MKRTPPPPTAAAAAAAVSVLHAPHAISERNTAPKSFHAPKSASVAVSSSVSHAPPHAAGSNFARPATLPSLVPPAPGAVPPVMSLPEPLQPPLIYSSGPLATHPSNPLVARFMAPHQAMLQAAMPRMPQLLPRAPNPANSPPPGSSVLSPPNPPRTQAPLKGSLACEACRYMHVRCNGSHPCDQCTRRRVPCSFSSYNKRKPAAAQQQQQQQQQHALQQHSVLASQAQSPSFAKWTEAPIKSPPPGYLIGPDGVPWPQQTIRRATVGASGSNASVSLSSSGSTIGGPSPTIPRAIAPAPPPPPHATLGSGLASSAVTEHTLSGPLVPGSLLQRVSIPVALAADPRPHTLTQVSHAPTGGALGFPGRLIPPPDYVLRGNGSPMREVEHPPEDPSRQTGNIDSRNAELVLGIVNRHWHQLNRINWCRQHKDVAPVYASVADMIQRGPGAELDVGAVYFTLEEWRTVSRALHKLGFAVRGRTIMMTAAVIDIFPILREAFSKQRTT